MIPMRTALLPAVLLAAVPTIASAEGFAPGAWSHWTDLVSADVGIPEFLVRLKYGHTTRNSCFAPQDVQRPEALLTQDDKAVCTKRKMEMSNGKFVFDTFCKSENFPEGLLVASTGTFTPKGYTILSTSSGTKKGRPVKIVTTGGGKWTGACK